jgi:hypothetical protein
MRYLGDGQEDDTVRSGRDDRPIPTVRGDEIEETELNAEERRLPLASSPRARGCQMTRWTYGPYPICIPIVG